MSFLTDLKAAPPAGRAVAFTAAALGLTYGYDISNIAGALLYLPQEFSLSSSQQAAMATAVVIGQIVGALIGGIVANAIGRRASMILIALGYALFAIISALAPSAGLLLIIRALLGITIGLSISIVPVFIAESAPSTIRGGLLVAYQVTTVIGIILGYIIAWALSYAESWRAMLGVAAIPAILVFFLLLRITETPQWLIMKGRDAEARTILAQREPDAAKVEKEIAGIHKDLAEQSGRGALSDMFHGYLLKASIFAIALGFFIQITGINATIYYAPKIFDQMGFTSTPQQLLLPALVQTFSLAAVIVSMFIVDKLGRRPVLLGGVGVMILANIILVIVYKLGGGFSGVYEILGLVGIIIFTMGYTFGFGAMVWVFAGEIFPTRYRALGSSLVLTSDLIANAIVAQAFPPLLDAVGGAGVFSIFGVLAAIAFVFIFRLAPETKGRELEEITQYWKNGARWPEEVRRVN